MNEYSVSKVSQFSGVSIRTLHHYDKIGLLKPKRRAESNYRYYGKDELYRLQQILFYRELGFQLKEIKLILDDPQFDHLRALKFQRIQILKQRDRLRELLSTIDKTIKNLEEEREMNENELYQGFPKEQIEAWNKEVDENYDEEIVAESKRNVQAMSAKEGFEVKQEMENIAREMSLLLGTQVSDDRVVNLMQRQHRANEQFYTTSAEMFKGLGEMYVSDARFTQYYDKYAPGTAVFMRDAMVFYADNFLE